MAEVDDLRDELAEAESTLARLPQVDEVQNVSGHEALALREERNELARHIEALSARIQVL
jgi:hypothetical protein